MIDADKIPPANVEGWTVALDQSAHPPERLGDTPHGSLAERGVADKGCFDGSGSDEAGEQAHRRPTVAAIETIGRAVPIPRRGDEDFSLGPNLRLGTHGSDAGESAFAILSP
jgi:hypothetical protein